jgi:hypothetical protein
VLLPLSYMHRGVYFADWSEGKECYSHTGDKRMPSLILTTRLIKKMKY